MYLDIIVWFCTNILFVKHYEDDKITVIGIFSIPTK